MKKQISILIPCYNEENSLPLLYKELCKVIDNMNNYDWEILFVNDGSRDNTLLLLKQLYGKDERVCYVDLSRNFGKERAMLAGFDYVTGDCAIIMDADLQHPPEIIPKMLEEWENGFDDVYGKRVSRGKESWLRRSFSLLFYKILQKTTNVEILQNVGDFRLLDSSCIGVLRQMREQERYTKGMFNWIGFRKKDVEFETQDRVAGVSSWSFRKLFSLAIEGITSFTVLPLKISTFIGGIVSLGAFIFMVFILINTVVYGEDVRGFPTLMVTILFLGGLQLLSIGVLGEYLGRIFNETKNRPTYVAREYNGEKIKY